jgi:peptidoglycan pentaglycine glycine transferase (the first glycine)
MSNFLQSKEWADFQRSLGREVFEYEKEGISAKIIKHDLPFGKNYLYIPHGPEIDFNQMTGGFNNPVVNFVKYLRDLGQKEKVIFVKAEPLIDSVAQALVGHRFKKSKKEIQPSKTVVVDLEGNDNELLGRMHHKTRYNIKVAEGHGVSVNESHDVDLFLKLLKKTAKRDKFSVHTDDYYRRLLGAPGLGMRLFLASYNSKPIAGAITSNYADTAYYLHGASDYDQRSFMAPYALHWHIMASSQRLGSKYYDFWGIDANKWPGVTRFKLGWGGRVVEHPGSFDLPISKAWYLVYNIARRF